MTETTVLMQTDLDLLAERVEKAAALVQRLKDDRQRLERELEESQTRLQETERRLHETERKLQGQDLGAVMGELQTLRLSQRQWDGERRDVASRIESLVKKLERLET